MPTDQHSTSSQSESNSLKRYVQSLQRLATTVTISSTFISTVFTTTNGTAEEVQNQKEDLTALLIPDIACDDPVWCSIPMPKKSHFRLSAPKDPIRWRKAQVAAANGDHVLLKRIRQHFPNALNFLDGDIKFTHYHHLVDHFVDKKNDLFPFVLTPPTEDEKIKKMKKKNISASGLMMTGDYSIEMPATYLADKMGRAPIIQMGYTRFERFPEEPYFKGSRLEDKNVLRTRLFDIWEKGRKQAGLKPLTVHNRDSPENKQPFLRTPIVFMSNLNENWGMFSMVVPNRTIDWVNCCTESHLYMTNRILDDDQVIAFFTNQHFNISHRKLISTPRGLSLQEHNMRLYIWDLMYTIPDKPSKLKSALVYTASSNWGYRPILKECILSKLNRSTSYDMANTTTNKKERLIEFDSYDKSLKGRVNEPKYYLKLINSRMTIAIPGLGYDTYRLWESLTLGLVPVLERGIGLDKTVWKLPVLLVDDFADVNEALLRSAYVEALYQVEEFEFERLTQSWWYHLILETSVRKSSSYLFEKFPPESEEPNFVRPAVPFNCWNTKSCGPGTKRIPKVSC